VAAAAAQAQAAWGSPTEALRIGRAGVEIARATGDRQALLDTLGSSAMAAVFAGDSVASMDFALEAIALGSSAQDPFTLAMVVLGQVTWTALQGDLAVAHEQLARAIETANQSGNQFVIAFAEVTRGRLAGFAGDAAEARAGFARAAALYHEIGDRRFELICRSDLAHALRRSGESAEALALYRETTREWQYLGNRGALAHELECFGFLAITDGRSPRAAKLFGQAAQLREISRMPFMPDEAVEYEQSLASLRQSIDPAAFEEAWQAGREMSLAEAIDYAVGG